MTPLDYVLSDRAGAYVLGGSLLVITLATIGAIVDIQLRGLEESGLAATIVQKPLLAPWAVLLIGFPASILTFAGSAIQAYQASTPFRNSSDALLIFLAINVGFLIAATVWALSAPLARHWGLGLAGFGLGLASLFPLLALVLRLNFQPFGVLAEPHERLLFAAAVGGILCSLGGCLASILSLAVYVVRRSLCLVSQHRLHSLAFETPAPPAASSRTGGAGTVPGRRRSAPRARRRPRGATAPGKLGDT